MIRTVTTKSSSRISPAPVQRLRLKLRMKVTMSNSRKRTPCDSPPKDDPHKRIIEEDAWMMESRKDTYR